MCFSKNISLATYLTGCVLSIMLFRIPNPFYKVIGLFFLFVTQMQLIDFLLWSHQKCDTYHRLVSRIGMWIHVLQPIVIILLAIHYSTQVEKKANVIIAFTLFYILCAFLYTRQYTTNLQCTTPRPGISHLIWNWTQLPRNYTFYFVYVFVSLLTIYLLFPHSDSVLFIILILSSHIITLIFNNNIGFSSIWCTYIIIIPAFYLVKHYLREHNYMSSRKDSAI